MLPEPAARPAFESTLVRIIATSGVVGIGVALGAKLVSQNVAGLDHRPSVAPSAILWPSRRL